MAAHPCLHTLIFTLALLIISTKLISAQGGPPSPGFRPSSRFRSIGFNQGFRNLWGSNHMNTDQTSLTIWLDKNSGSGFKSHNMYRSGYFSASMKLQPGYTAGVITSLYLSNNQDFPGHHDEIDIEFLGTTAGKPYTLQTNVYMRGSGDGRIVGREMQFHLWFDPTQDFHDYAILWSPNEIIFFVDDVPIRRYPRKVDSTYPQRPMYLYGSIWDASSWATEDGKYKADYKYQPFVGQYRNFKLSGCTTNEPSSCRAPSVSPSGSSGLSRQQISAMLWAHKNHMVYNYCSDPKRDHSQLPEC